ncbi:MAG: DNA recombination protein RmuC [Proteobacteria bacterium]|nr:DNA recombination protein RmuC [Pseudomonadota bacterium]
MDVLLVVIVVLSLVAVLLLALLWRRDPAQGLGDALDARLAALRQDNERLERGLREDLRGTRGETQTALAAFDARLGLFTERTDAGLGALRQNLGDDARRGREEAAAAMQRFAAGLQQNQEQSRADMQAALAAFDARLGLFTERTDAGLGALRQNLGDDARRGREEAAAGLLALSAALTARLDKANETTERHLGEVRQTLDKQIKELQADNAARLEQMRATVDEKLQATLEARLGESFRQVSERLEQVHRGLGEMKSLAGGVDDLKRVLGNVKSRGVFGEAQLAGILEQILTPDQYAANVVVRPGSNERVEYAVRLPGADGKEGPPVWLPIDAKFPREDYEKLLKAQEDANAEQAASASAALERRLREEAKTIQSKYIDPPHTTDFAILFLPTEGLYAEALRRPGLVDALFREQRIVLAGPTTLAATLSSLRMGFRTLAIEQRSGEVWKLLGAVKTEFGKFGDVLDKVKKKLDEASGQIDATGVRSRAIERKLRRVESASVGDSQLLLGNAADAGGDDSVGVDDGGAG